MKTFMDRNATRYYHEEWLTAKVVGPIAVAAESSADDTLAAMLRFKAFSNPDELPVVSSAGAPTSRATRRTTPSSWLGRESSGA
jgi:multimeric flavodoxin WrbA